MPVLEKLEKLNHTVIDKIEWVGLAGLLVMMFITCFDVLGAKLFLHPIPGALDTVELAQLVAISFAVAAALLEGRHVQVEFFVVLLPKRLRACVDFIVQLLDLFLFIIIVWQLAKYGHYLRIGGEVSATVRIPLFPFAYGAALASIPMCLVFLFELLKSFSRMIKR